MCDTYLVLRNNIIKLFLLRRSQVYTAKFFLYLTRLTLLTCRTIDICFRARARDISNKCTVGQTRIDQWFGYETT